MMRDPQLSPIHGDFHGLPPAILISGTRDLYLSNTVRIHRKLRRAGIEAALQVYEGCLTRSTCSTPRAWCRERCSLKFRSSSTPISRGR